jgi:Bacterial extracellular solute-binding proteins, family 3/Ligand-gated ion channel
MARTAFSVFWMFAGVVFVAFYTAQLTTNLTVRQMQGSIAGPDDLAGKRVATVASTVAADYLRAHNVEVQEFHRASSMIQALQSKQVDAIVFQAPVLLYDVAHEGKGIVKVVGPEFDVAPIASASNWIAHYGDRSIKLCLRCARTVPTSRFTTSGSAVIKSATINGSKSEKRLGISDLLRNIKASVG